MQDLQPLVLDMGTGQQASGSDLDKVLSPGHHACLSREAKLTTHVPSCGICGDRHSAALHSLNCFYQAIAYNVALTPHALWCREWCRRP